MTSAKVMLSVATAGALMCAAALPGCHLAHRGKAPPLEAPYAEPQTWAVAPLRNESGSRQVDPARVADHLTQQLERAERLHVVPVNRVLAAMESLEMQTVASPEDAAALRELLAVDGLVVGTVTAYEPFDPPKLGLAVELYTGPQIPEPHVEIRRLTRAASDRDFEPPAVEPNKPVSVTSGYYDAAAPEVRRRLKDYGVNRGGEDGREQWRRYRLSMDLYTEFVSYLVGEQLLEAEHERLVPTSTQTSSAP